MTKKLIDCQNIVKIYQNGGLNFEALHSISFAINEGEFCAITGPSGCGKSTLLNVLGLLDTPTKGRYILNDIPTEKMTDYQKTLLRRSSIGFIFQNFNLLPNISIMDNIKMPLFYNGASAAFAEQRAEELLKAVGLIEKKKNTPLQISGGQKQRVCIARALANNPKVLIADEPTGNLDFKSGQDIMQLFSNLNKSGLTIIMVTHDLNLAQKTGRTIKMLDGNIV